MKKIILSALMLSVAFCVFAGAVNPIVNLKPYFWFDNSPAGTTDTDGDKIVWNDLSASWWERSQDYWYDAFQKPNLLDLGLTVDTDKVDMVFILDVGQDTLQQFMDEGQNKTNIPFLGATIDMNFPRIGYLDYTSEDENLYLSFGRRQIKWGPGTYDMAVSDSQPYLDALYFEYNVPMKNDWNFWYSFMGSEFRQFLSYSKFTPEKSVFAHRLGFESPYLRIALAELNMVYGKVPSFYDYTPFGLWHNNYQDDNSNVMLDLDIEGTYGPVRAFFGFTMDDFDLPHELGEDGWSNKPQAFGLSAGVEVNLLEGEKVQKTEFNFSDYVLAEDTFKKDTGLNIGYEIYYCSTFMYNRKVNEGKFTIPFEFISFAADTYSYNETAFFLGFKYGPDTLLNRFYVEYNADPIEAWASAEIIKRGAYCVTDDINYGSKDTYYKPQGLETMKITGDITKALKIEAGAAYYLQDAFKVNGSIGFEKDLTHGTSAFSASFGTSISLCKVDWNNLF